MLKRKIWLCSFSLLLYVNGCVSVGVARWNVLIVKGSYVWVGIRMRYVGVMDLLDFYV